jgi:phosphoribosylamine--glycine ligase
MNVLLIGGGGREHALAWKLEQSPELKELFLAPGSDGMANLGQRLGLNVDDHAAVVAACKERQIGLVMVGPEGPLAAGIADSLRHAGITVFGPGKLGAQLEASKDVSKQFMVRHGVATAQARSFDNAAAAKVFAQGLGWPVVIKADGLAAGKGVSICEDAAQLDTALSDCFDKKLFGAAGSRVLVEEFMRGEEASLLCFCDGKTLRPMAAAQDHKRVGDGDTGPNTGGMGAYSPAPVLTDAVMAQVWERILTPTLAGLHADGLDFRGCLYVGLMLTEQGPKVVEYNCRFGDPETQVVLPRMGFDLLPVLLACAEGRLAELPPLVWKPEACATVVLASKGYPASAEKGSPISGLDAAAAVPGAIIFHAGSAAMGAGFASNGGRVLNVTGVGLGLRAALDAAYAAMDKIKMPGGHFRRDIGHRALAKEGNSHV